MRLGIGSWTYGWAIGVKGYPSPPKPLTTSDLIDRAREFQVDVVQIADNLRVHALSQSELLRLRNAASDSHIALELGTVGVEPSHLERYLELAVFLRARLVRTLIREPAGRSDLNEAEEFIRHAAARFRSAGVALALENYEAQTCAELAALVERIGEPCVGVCLDTVNSLGALETPREVVAALAPHILNLHVKDFVIRRVPSKMGYEVSGSPAGEGRLDIDWLVGELRGLEREPAMILEQWTPWQGSIEQAVSTEEEWAIRSIAFLRRYQ